MHRNIDEANAAAIGHSLRRLYQHSKAGLEVNAGLTLNRFGLDEDLFDDVMDLMDRTESIHLRALKKVSQYFVESPVLIRFPEESVVALAEEADRITMKGKIARGIAFIKALDAANDTLRSKLIDAVKNHSAMEFAREEQAFSRISRSLGEGEFRQLIERTLAAHNEFLKEK